MGKKRIFVSTLILTGSALVARVLSMYYRVVLSQHIGAEGMGLFELIFSVYLMVVTLAYSGVNIAVTRLAAEGKNGAGLLSAALKIVAPIGLLTGVALFLLAGEISSSFLGDIRAEGALLALAPSVPFMSVSACINAYFIGKGDGAYRAHNRDTSGGQKGGKFRRGRGMHRRGARYDGGRSRRVCLRRRALPCFKQKKAGRKNCGKGDFGNFRARRGGQLRKRRYEHGGKPAFAERTCAF